MSSKLLKVTIRLFKDDYEIVERYSGAAGVNKMLRTIVHEAADRLRVADASLRPAPPAGGHPV